LFEPKSIEEKYENSIADGDSGRRRFVRCLQQEGRDDHDDNARRGPVDDGRDDAAGRYLGRDDGRFLGGDFGNGRRFVGSDVGIGIDVCRVGRDEVKRFARTAEGRLRAAFCISLR
jgi:hypothetical protein